jgi:AraC-like DNA-binding protein
VGLEGAAAEAGLSPYYFHRMFVRAFRETPHEFVTRRRLEEARRLLARTETPVTEVCFAVGYESLGSFSTRFRLATGVAPSEFRRALRRAWPSAAVAPHRLVPSCFMSFYGVPVH